MTKKSFGRAIENALHAPFKERPRWVAIRQTKLAIQCRDAIYGCKARPFGRLLRLNWTRLVSWYTKTRALECPEVVAVAEALGAQLSQDGRVPRLDVPMDDLRVRRWLSERLTAAAHEKRKRSPPRRRRDVEQEVLRARIDAHRKQALLDGLCPGCFDDLPCDPCGYPDVEIDGHGGLRAVS